MFPVPARLLRTVALLVVGAPLSAAAQVTSGAGFAPGARTIVDLNFAGTPVGDLPKGLRVLQGNMEVVDKDGVRMLRASSPSEFVLQLPEALPKDFTLEFELIPKACCNPVDLAVEGVISGGRSSVSAQLEWDAEHFAVVGGNPQMFQMDMPPAIAATLPSTLTTVAMSFEDETVKMYTNGKRLYTLAARKFVRGRVLRIWLGGQDDDKYAVYLARLRVADAAATIATSQSASTGSGLANTLNGATLSTTGGGAVPVPVTPTATAVAVPSNPGVTAGPLPAGTVAPTAAQTSATQPAALSSPTNPLPVVTSAPTAQQQNPGLAQPRGSTGATATGPPAAATGPLSTVTDPTASATKLAGPTNIRLVAVSGSGSSAGWGVAITWTPVASATSYRIIRTVTGSGIAGAPVDVISIPAGLLGSSSSMYALDATVEPSTGYTYWIEGVLISGALTNPSEIASVQSGTPPVIYNLSATVSGTTQVVLPGVFGSGAPTSGSNVTWKWDLLPFAFVYEISYQIVGKPGQERRTLKLPVTIPPATLTPVTFGVPQGAKVYFCVSVWGSPDAAKSLPASATCLTTQVP